MDWKRAKTILIIVFLILNLVLAITIYKSLDMEEVSQQTITNTREILEQNNIHIECPIPKDTGNDYILQYEEKFLDKTKIVNKMLGNNNFKVDDNSYKNGSKSLVFTSDSGFEFTDTGYNRVLNIDNKDDVNKYLKELSEELGLPFDEFTQDGYLLNVKTDDGAKVIYKGEYKGYTVFDNYIEFEVNKSGIKSIKYHYKKPISMTVKKDIDIIPVYSILISKMTNYPGISIKTVDKGFKGYTEVDKETKTLWEGLSWRIKTYDGKEFYFNARNGEEME